MHCFTLNIHGRETMAARNKLDHSKNTNYLDFIEFLDEIVQAKCLKKTAKTRKLFKPLFQETIDQFQRRFKIFGGQWFRYRFCCCLKLKTHGFYVLYIMRIVLL